MTSRSDHTPHILLVNPWIHDFAAYDFWAAPLGLLEHGGYVARPRCAGLVCRLPGPFPSLGEEGKTDGLALRPGPLSQNRHSQTTGTGRHPAQLLPLRNSPGMAAPGSGRPGPAGPGAGDLPDDLLVSGGTRDRRGDPFGVPPGAGGSGRHLCDPVRRSRPAAYRGRPGGRRAGGGGDPATWWPT